MQADDATGKHAQQPRQQTPLEGEPEGGQAALEDVSVAAIAAQAARAAGSTEEQIATSNERLRQILVQQGRISEDTPLEDAMTAQDYTFAGNVAEQVGGANLSEVRERPDTDKEQAMAQAAKVRDWESRLAGLDFDQRVAETLECFGRRRQFAEVMKDLLEYCTEERTLEDAEAHIAEHPNYEKNRQSAHQYLLFMQRTGAIEEREYTGEGALVTDEMRQELACGGATEEEIEDLAEEWRYQTTEVGQEALRREDPFKKFKELVAAKTSRRLTYKRVIDFCETPRSMDEIFQFLQGDPGLEVNAQGIMGCQPSAYVSKLEDAGVLVWRNGGWQLTKGGVAILKAIAG